MQPEVGERELPLVDEEPVVGPTGGDLVRDLLERELAERHVAEHEPERQERRRQRAGDDDLLAAEVVDASLRARDDDGP